MTDDRALTALKRIVEIGTECLNGKYPLDIAYNYVDKLARKTLADITSTAPAAANVQKEGE